MGILKTLFGGNKDRGKEEKKALPWKSLTSLDQLGLLKDRSAEKVQFIYKHSTSCGISSMVLRMLEGTAGISDGEADFYFLDLHRYRNVSQAVASEFQIAHESPQLLVVKQAKVIAAASHGAITEMDLQAYL